jgi:hypothetical protein
LHLTNLQLILRISYKIIEEGNPKHPAVFVLLAVLARWGVESWGDQEILPTGEASQIESVLKPHLESVISVADGDAAEVCSILDRVSSEFYKQLAKMPDRL